MPGAAEIRQVIETQQHPATYSQRFAAARAEYMASLAPLPEAAVASPPAAESVDLPADPFRRLQTLLEPTPQERADVTAALNQTAEYFYELKFGTPEQAHVGPVIEGIRWQLIGEPGEPLPDCFIGYQAPNGTVHTTYVPEYSRLVSDAWEFAYGLSADFHAVRKAREPEIRGAITECIVQSPGYQLIKSFEQDGARQRERPLTADEKLSAAAQLLGELCGDQAIGLDELWMYPELNRRYQVVLGRLEDKTVPGNQRLDAMTSPHVRARQFFGQRLLAHYNRQHPGEPYYDWEDVPDVNRYVGDVVAEINGTRLNDPANAYLARSISSLVRGYNLRSTKVYQTEEQYRQQRVVDLAYGDLVAGRSYINDHVAVTHWLREAPQVGPDRTLDFNERMRRYWQTEPVSGDLRQHYASRDTLERELQAVAGTITYDDRTAAERARGSRVIMKLPRAALEPYDPSQTLALQLSFEPAVMAADYQTHQPYIPGYILVGETWAADGSGCFDFVRDPAGDPRIFCDLPISLANQKGMAADAARLHYDVMAAAIEQAPQLSVGQLEQMVRDGFDYYAPAEPELVLLMPHALNGRAQGQCVDAYNVLEGLLLRQFPPYAIRQVGGHVLPGEGTVINGAKHAQLLLTPAAGERYLLDATPLAPFAAAATPRLSLRQRIGAILAAGQTSTAMPPASPANTPVAPPAPSPLKALLPELANTPTVDQQELAERRLNVQLTAIRAAEQVFLNTVRQHFGLASQPRYQQPDAVWQYIRQNLRRPGDPVTKLAVQVAKARSVSGGTDLTEQLAQLDETVRYLRRLPEAPTIARRVGNYDAGLLQQLADMAQSLRSTLSALADSQPAAS